MKNLIYTSGVWSIVIQIITFLIGLVALFVKTPISLLVVKQLLWVETIVQLIEFIFYIWMVKNFSKIKNITKYRYYDWVLSTPLMLYVYIMYLEFMKNKENVNGIQKNLLDLTKDNLTVIIVVLLLNALMLMFGYLAEIKKMSFNLAAVLGFIPFIIMFYMIYVNYAQYTKLGASTFWFFSGIWALYGIASVMSYKIKNISYNILDLFAKNFFGLYLAYILFYNK
jgi:bacteriorhodopsin